MFSLRIFELYETFLFCSVDAYKLTALLWNHCAQTNATLSTIIYSKETLVILSLGYITIKPYDYVRRTSSVFVQLISSITVPLIS